ncbi:NAD-binding lipoprotein [Streptomyces sp. NPDC093272]|uniref:CASTOR/POLLUX-related putative ion channel n=1 Tax=Streptomyces sp. NPDC093272 TaxID=3154981 RepID=UPI003445A4B5
MDRRQERTPLRHRARYLFDRTLARSTGTLLGWLALCCLAVVVPVSTLLVWTDPDAPHSVSGRLAQVWRTSAETLRLGAVTGTLPRMLLSVLLGLIALLCVSTVVGVVTTGLGEQLTELRRGRSRVLERDHDVVVGWNDQIVTVVRELTAGRAGGGRHVITVLADRDPAQTEAALTAALGVTEDVRLVCRSGTLTDPDDLALVTPAAARAVVVLPAEDADGDLTTVRTLLALHTLLADAPGPRVVAAVHDGRYLPAARLAAGPRGTVLETDRTAARLLVQSARRPGMPSALRDLLDFSGAEFHVTEVPDAVGLSFEEVALRLDTSCAVGLLRPDGRPLLTPAPRTVVEPGDRLVTVAHDDRPVPLLDRWAPVDTTALAPSGPAPEPAARLLLLGWNRRAPMIVDALCRTVRPGSSLDVVTDPGTDLELALARHRPLDSDTAAPALTVTHHTRDLAAPEALHGLELSGYDSVIALGTDHGPAPEGSDAPTLLALLTLRSWEERTGRVLPVVAELHDRRSGRVAPLGHASDVVVRGELTALVMAQIAHDPQLAAVFEEIFTVRGGALALRTADHYVLPGREAAFATVVAAALERGECAIGYHAHVPRTARRYGAVRLAPGKSERRVWQAEDEVLVLTAGPGRDDTDPERRILPGPRPQRSEPGGPPGPAGPAGPGEPAGPGGPGEEAGLR